MENKDNRPEEKDTGMKFSEKERELLSIMEHEPEEDFARITWEKKDPDLLYQLSPWRKNLVSWLPVRSTDHVLEMEAGYGPMTSSFAERAEEVVCLERTEARYIINSVRQKDRPNVTCGIWDLSGDDVAVQEYLKHMSDAEEDQVRKFEWVIVYRSESALSLRSDLELASAFTAEDGRIVLAVDNVHGMRTRDGGEIPAGASTKQELERIFTALGMEAVFYYPYQSLAFADSIYSDRFLPRSEELSTYEQGFRQVRVCWCNEQEEYAWALEHDLYPDVANAYLCILTPARKKKEEAQAETETAKQPEAESAAEKETAKQPEAESAAEKETAKQPEAESAAETETENQPEAENAEIKETPEPPEEKAAEKIEAADVSTDKAEKKEKISPQRQFPIYVKFSNQRRRGLNIVTEIFENEHGRRRVFKRPADKESRSWIAGISGKYLQLTAVYEGTDLAVNHCERGVDGIELEYLQGKSLDILLDACLADGRTDRAEKLLDAYWKRLTSGHPLEKFTPTHAYREVFGDNVIEREEPSLPATDIDMIFSNILLPEGWEGEFLEQDASVDGNTAASPVKWCIIDYEWTFDFPVPVRFVMWRALDYYENYRPERKKFVESLYQRYGIRPEDREVYRAMEGEFQKWVLGDTHPIRLHNSAYGKPSISYQEAITQLTEIHDVIASSRAESEELRKQMEELQNRCTEFSNTVAEMRASFSWRITAPLRAISGFFRRLFHRGK